MANPAPLNEDDRTDLVAYLDGELDEEAARALEAKLSRDPRARAEADAMRQAWELLDYLPRPGPSADFTNRTLDRVSAMRPTSATMVARQRRRWWLSRLGWVAAIMLAALGGYAAMSLVPERWWAGTPKPSEADEQLVRDLRVIDNLRFYQQAEEIKFLRELEHPDLFGDDRLGY